MNLKPLVVLGSARKESDTGKFVNQLLGKDAFELVDLLDYSINHYSYTGQYPPDDSFMVIVEQILQHDRIIFATPVYWYSMSGILKIFFDRLTDLVTTRKEIGRQLKDRKVYLIAVGTDNQLPNSFSEPFKLTSDYFEMEFVASLYCKAPDFHVKGNEAEAFIKSLAP